MGICANHNSKIAGNRADRLRHDGGMDEVDVAIVGAGPTGLFAAYYAGFRGLSVAVIDTLPEPGGQISAMYPEKDIFDVGGFPVIKGRDLVVNLIAQAATVEEFDRLRAELLARDDGHDRPAEDGP